MRMVFPHNVPTRFLNDMNALVESIFGDEAKVDSGSQSSSSGYVPAMDIEESATAFALSLDLPGVDPEGIDIEVENDHVSISGARERAASNEDVSRQRHERSFGQFHRQFRLPEEVDQDGIVADYDQGVLTIHLPKLEKQGAKKIVIKGVTKTATDDDAK